MLLGTDIQAVLTTLAALDVDVIGLNCSTGPEDMRDAIRYLGEHSPAAGPLHPERRPAAAGPRRRDDLPRDARADLEGARRVRRALRRRRSSAAAAAPRPTTSRAIAERVARPRARRAPRAGPAAGLELDDDRDAARPGAARRRWSASASTRRARARRRSCCSPTTTTASSRSPRTRSTGGAHVLDVCVALTERQDEDEQMREVVEARLADPAGADPDRLDRARGDRGRARAASPAARSSTRSTSRPAATSSTASCRSRRRTAPR